jgi:hypothetical protein
MFERACTDFLQKKYGKVDYPISTDDLTTLIEQDVADLDQYADLSPYGDGVEGMTEFPRSGKPRVAISHNAHRYENRLRTTLAHEYGHVRLHAPLFVLGDRQLKLGQNRKPNAIYCLRDAMLPAGKRDWMEWQAGYASGAALMPKTPVTRLVAQIQERFGVYGAVSPESAGGQSLISAVMDRFSVSRDAAVVRLKILGFLGIELAVRSLFS